MNETDGTSGSAGKNRTRLYLVDVPDSEKSTGGPHFRVLLEIGQIPPPGGSVPADLQPFVDEFKRKLRGDGLQTLNALPLPIEIPLLSRISTGRLSTNDLSTDDQ